MARSGQEGDSQCGRGLGGLVGHCGHVGSASVRQQRSDSLGEGCVRRRGSGASTSRAAAGEAAAVPRGRGRWAERGAGRGGRGSSQELSPPWGQKDTLEGDEK